MKTNTVKFFMDPNLDIYYIKYPVVLHNYGNEVKGGSADKYHTVKGVNGIKQALGTIKRGNVKINELG